MVNAQGQLMPAATVRQLGFELGTKALTIGLTADQLAAVVREVEHQQEGLLAAGADTSWQDGFLSAVRPAAVRPSTCPGCSGSGVLSDDPQVLKCTGCGGIFTDAELPITLEQARKFVALDQPMKAEAGLDGSFYFDLDVLDAILADGTVNRIHGWADRRTKRVVQWG